MKLETLAIHAGYSPEPTTHSVAVPIYQTSSYAFDDTQHGADLFNLAVPGNIYTRITNPTNAVLEQRIAALEGGIAGLALASGMAAITYAIQTITEAGENIVSVAKLYGGTYNLLAHTLPRFGIETRFAQHDDLVGLEKLIDDRSDALSKNILDSIIEIAHNCKLESFAEGIETEEQANYLKEKGVRFLQGYLLAKPMPINEFINTKHFQQLITSSL